MPTIRPSTHPFVARRAQRVPPVRPQHLPCPSCGHALYVASRDFVEGGEAPCAYCDAQPVLTREWDKHAGRYYWTLVDPGTEFDESRDG